jgi:hypothetical protein
LGTGILPSSTLRDPLEITKRRDTVNELGLYDQLGELTRGIDLVVPNITLFFEDAGDLHLHFRMWSFE